MKKLNDLFLYLKTHNLTIRQFSEATGIEYNRSYRLTHSDQLLNDLKVNELGAITEAFPDFLIDY
jgi:hypothetical protein